MWNCLYAKNFWHLPIPDQPLSDITLPNGIRYRVIEPQQRYEIGYDDPDGGDELHVSLTFDAVTPPHYLGQSHLDQPGRYTGTIVLRGEEIPVDSYGFRDRSWGVRSQFGQGLTSSPARHGGYSYATQSAENAFHTITMDFGSGMNSIHGYLLLDGTWAKIQSATRTVVERSPDTAFQTRVVIEGVDELGRELHAEGRCINQLGVLHQPQHVDGELPHRVDVQRHHDVRRGSRQLECRRRSVSSPAASCSASQDRVSILPGSSSASSPVCSHAGSSRTTGRGVSTRSRSASSAR